MSWQASQYARATLETDEALRPSTRLVFMLVAERIPRTAPFVTWGGDWLARSSRLKPGSVRRALYELDEAGYVSVVRHQGKALQIRFPDLSNVRAPVRALDDERARTGERGARTGARTSAHGCAPYQSDTGLDTAPARCDSCGEPVAEPGRWRHQGCPPPAAPSWLAAKKATG